MNLRLAFLMVAFQACMLTGTEGKSKKVLLVSFDGMRRDYLNRGLTPTFQKLMDEGVTAERVYPVYPTYTQPCHYTMVTGRNSDHHGVVANSFYEKSLGNLGLFFEGYNQNPEFWNYNNTEPIWITAVKQGKIAGGYYWSGIRVSFPDKDGFEWQASFAKGKRRRRGWEVTVASVLRQYTERNADFIALHYSEPDGTGHYAGPDTDNMTETLKDVDSKLNYLLNKISEYGLSNKLNLIIVSDHGMAKVNKTVNIGVDYNISQSHYFPWTWGGVMFLDATARGDEKEIYRKLLAGWDDFETYYKDEVPARYNFGENPRIGKIVLMPRVGVQVRPGGEAPVLTEMLPQVVNVLCDRGRNLTVANFSFCSDNQVNNQTVMQILDEVLHGSGSLLTGNHGYDNQHPLMEPIFIAYGPDIKKNHRLGTIHQVDYYSLMTRLLQIVPQPHDGSFDNVKGALVNPEADDSSATCRYPTWSLLLLLTLLSAWMNRSMLLDCY